MLPRECATRAAIGSGLAAATLANRSAILAMRQGVSKPTDSKQAKKKNWQRFWIIVIFCMCVLDMQVSKTVPQNMLSARLVLGTVLECSNLQLRHGNSASASLCWQVRWAPGWPGLTSRLWARATALAAFGSITWKSNGSHGTDNRTYVRIRNYHFKQTEVPELVQMHDIVWANLCVRCQWQQPQVLLTPKLIHCIISALHSSILLMLFCEEKASCSIFGWQIWANASLQQH